MALEACGRVEHLADHVWRVLGFGPGLQPGQDLGIARGEVMFFLDVLGEVIELHGLALTG